MQPILHDDDQEPEGPKPARLALRSRPDGYLLFECLDKSGASASTIAGFGAKGPASVFGAAKGALERSGYDTSWAEWNSKGQIVLGHPDRLIDDVTLEDLENLTRIVNFSMECMRGERLDAARRTIARLRKHITGEE